MAKDKEKEGKKLSKAFCKVRGHKWNGCKCDRCGLVRDEGHDYQPIDGKSGRECSICGKKETIPSKFWSTLSKLFPFMKLEKKDNKVTFLLCSFVAVSLIVICIAAALSPNDSTDIADVADTQSQAEDISANIPPQETETPAITPDPTDSPANESADITETPEPAETPTPIPSPAPAPAPVTGNLTVHFLDVGQADSIFIELPNGEYMLIDGGESSNSSQIRTYITGQGAAKIDYLVATHPHADHIGGLPGIIDNMEIGAIYMPRVSHTTRTFENLLTSIENKDMQIDTAKAGVSILDEPGLSIDIVAPVRDTYDDLNDYSAVVRIVYGNTGFLFTGDAEAISEGDMTGDISADVLKIGHHGSNSSTGSGFLGRVSPAFAVISAGTGNSYGHPTENTLSKLYDAGINVYRTDLQGTIVFTSDGENITVSTEPAERQTPAPQPTTAPDATQEAPSASGSYIGNANSSIFHKASCSSVNRMAEHNKVPYSTRDDAINAGMRPCQNCNP